MLQREWRKVASPRFAIGTVTAVGLVGAFIALYLPNAYTRVLPAFVLVGAVVGALGYRNGFPIDHRSLVSTVRVGTSLRGGLIALWFALAGTVAAGYALAGFQRPLAVQLLLVGLYGVVALSVVVLESSRTSLLLLVATAVFHRALVYYVGAIQLGNDALFHTRAAEAIVASGSLAPLATSKYWYAPLYHLVVGFSSLGLGIPIRDAAFLLVTVPATVVPPIVVYAFLRRDWNGAVGVFGALLFVVADHAILNAVHATPTSLGLVFVAVMLLYAERYLRHGRREDVAVFAGALVGLLLTHQLSMFVAVVMLGTYVGMTAFWRGRLGWRELQLATLLTVGFVLQSVVTRYNGPEGEGGSFLMTVAPSIVSSALGGLTGGGRTAAYPPATADVAVGGADALTVVQVLGLGVLFGFAVLGTVVWVSRSAEAPLRQAIALGGVTVVMSVLVFVPPAIGVSVLIPGRWFPFIYLALALLAAPSVGLLLTKTTAVTARPLVPLLIVLVLVLPYAGLMTMNTYGAPDNPVFDEAPGATRLTTTDLEASGYEFVDGYSGDALVVADFGGWRVIERYYGQPTAVYITRYGEDGTAFDGEQLLVYRAYAGTDHASYFLGYQGNRFRVYGPLPGPEAGDSTVYSNGDVRVFYHPPDSG